MKYNIKILKNVLSLPLTFTVLGTFIGYIFIHPFTHIVQHIFHLHGKILHIHWDKIFLNQTLESFKLIYWPHVLSYSTLTAIIGFLFGKAYNSLLLVMHSPD